MLALDGQPRPERSVSLRSRFPRMLSPTSSHHSAHRPLLMRYLLGRTNSRLRLESCSHLGLGGHETTLAAASDWLPTSMAISDAITSSGAPAGLLLSFIENLIWHPVGGESSGCPTVESLRPPTLYCATVHSVKRLLG